MRKNIGFCALLALLCLVLGCQKELKTDSSNNTNQHSSQPVTSALQGTVLDEIGLPAAGVQIKIGNRSVLTDRDGHFRLHNLGLDKVASLVTAEKTGYFKAYRSFAAGSGTNLVVIKMMKRNLAGTINASSGGEVTLAGGAKVRLNAASVVNEANGNSYAGSVSVFAAVIDPTTADFADLIPGSSLALDKNNQRTILSPFGLLAVQLEGTGGEKLQIKTGSVAAITMPIPAARQSNAPATVPLWSLNETTGLWKEEGTATRQGNSYTAEVKHFSYWNYSSALPATTVQMKIVHANGNPVAGAMIMIRNQNLPDSAKSYGYTDSLGQAGGLVTANVPLVLQVMDRCGTPVYTQNIGPFSQPTNIGTITIPNTTNGIVTFRGKLMNCSGSAIAGGYVRIQLGMLMLYGIANNNGEFALTTVNCGNTSVTANAIDPVTLQSGQATSTITIPETNFGNLAACGTSVNEFLTVVLDGVTTSYLTPQHNLLLAISPIQGTTNWSNRVYGFQSNGNQVNYMDLTFQSNAQVPGSYAVSTLRLPGHFNPVLLAPFNVNIINYAAATGQMMEGNLNGQFRDSVNVVHQINASFRIRRNF